MCIFMSVKVLLKNLDFRLQSRAFFALGDSSRCPLHRVAQIH